MWLTIGAPTTRWRPQACRPSWSPWTRCGPFTEDELEEVIARVETKSTVLADVTLVAGWTGLRWGELRVLRVGDVQLLPSPAFWVARSQTEGGKVKVTKSRSARRVPLADLVVEAVRRMSEGKSAEDLLATGAHGGQLWRSAFLRASGWETVAMGRRLHDLRHSAACLWLTRGVDLSTVSASRARLDHDHGPLPALPRNSHRYGGSKAH